jgi:hypothetical protein
MIYFSIQLYEFILFNKHQISRHSFHHDPIIIPYSPFNMEYDHLYTPTY